MDNVQIEILDPDNNIEGVLDVGNSKNFSMSLTTSIADIKDISTRSGSFSTSFKVPSTKDNDNLLDHIYLSQHKNYKDFDAEKDCRIRVNGINIEKGKLQITRIAREGRDGNSYSLKFFGNNMDWVLNMKEKTTQDLPYLDNTFTYDSTSVEASWQDSGANQQPLYALINRGQKTTLGAYNVLDLRPDYYVIDYLNNAFKSVGYNFESTFFNTTANKKLIIPFFGKNFRDYDRSVSNTAIVKLDTSATNFDNTFTTAAGTFNDVIRFDALTVSEMEDQRMNYQATSFSSHAASTGGGITITNASIDTSFSDTPAPLKDDSSNYASNQYVVPYNNKYRVKAIIDAVLTEDQTKAFLNPQLNHYIKLTRGGNVSKFPMVAQSQGTEVITNVSSNRQKRTFTREVASSWFSAQAGDILEIGYEFYVNKGQGTWSSDDYYFKLEHNPTIITYEPYPYLDEGDTFNWATVSDDNISVLDIVLDIGRLFHIYWETNTATKTVSAEPRDDYYNEISTATNETDRVDPSKQFEITYNSSAYKRNQVFRYKEDDKDGYLVARNKEAATEWCSYEHSFPSKFVEGTTSVETKVLSATYTLEDIYCGGGIAPILARFWVDETNLKNIYESEALAPRILYFRYTAQFDIDGNFRDFQWRTESTTRKSIPYALPFPVYDEGQLLATVPNELTFKEVQGDDGLWYDNYRLTAAEIRDGKSLALYLRTDLVDYKNIDFKKIYYFDNRYPDIEGYWRLIRVSNFKPTSNEISVKHEFTQARNFEAEATTPDLTDEVESGLDNNNTQTYRQQPPNTGINTGESTSGGRQSHSTGFDNNIKDSSNIAFGNGLSTDGTGVLRMGINNLDVSTDLFQLGTGTPDNPFSILRVDQSGNTYFNGELVVNGDVYVDVTTDYTMNGTEKGIYLDSSSGGFTLTLPPSPSNDYQCKIIDSTGSCGGNNVTVDGNGYNINGGLSGTISSDYESWNVIFNGTQYNI